MIPTMPTSYPAVDITVADQTFKLQFGFNEICEAEDVIDAPFVKVLHECDRGKMSAMRFVLWTATRKPHRDVTLSDVGRWIDAMGIDAMVEHLQRVLPKDEKAAPATTGRKKPKAA